MKVFFTIVLTLLVLAFGCSTNTPVDEIPVINFEGVSVYKNKAGKDSMMVLSINYKDGDGDLGLSINDTLPPYNYGNIGFYSLYVAYKIVKNNNWQSILIPGSADSLHFNQRFQRLSHSDKTRAVSGNLLLRIPASPYPGLKPDSILLLAHMLDRKLHKSNQITSGAVKLKH